MKIDVRELMKELDRWQIRVSIEYGRAVLSCGDKRARRHYSELIEENPELEADLILELAKHDKDLMFEIEERASIRFADGLPGDLRSAVTCNFTKGY